jgi:hypothetical protein
MGARSEESEEQNMNKKWDRDGAGLTEAIAAHAFGKTGEARSVAAYLAHRVLRISPPGTARACARVAAKRRDPQFDRIIGWLETLLRSAVAA